MNHEAACRAFLRMAVPLVALDVRACGGCGKPMGPGDEYDGGGVCTGCVESSFAESG